MVFGVGGLEFALWCVGLRFGVRYLGVRVQGLVFGVGGFGFGVWCLVVRIWGARLEVWGFGV